MKKNRRFANQAWVSGDQKSILSMVSEAEAEGQAGARPAQVSSPETGPPAASPAAASWNAAGHQPLSLPPEPGGLYASFILCHKATQRPPKAQSNLSITLFPKAYATDFRQ